MNKDSRILVAGANGMVGRAIVRKLVSEGYNNIIRGTRFLVDFTNQQEVRDNFEFTKPEYVFLAAARVGGIMDNKNNPADFIYDNLMIQTNIIHNSYKFGVKKLLFLGSSCIYPKHATQPITEDQLLSSPLEPTNDAYAIAKIAGIKMCQAYAKQYGFNAISLMPTNLYGPHDNFNPETSHVLPGLIHKCHTAKVKGNGGIVECWGDGSPYREFMHVDDLADACLYLMNNYDSPKIINVGTGTDITISELANIVGDVVGYTGLWSWDKSKPNGTPRKLLNVDKLHMVWKHKIDLVEGIKQTYKWYLENE